MAGGFPQLPVDELGGFHLLITGAFQAAAHIAFHHAVEGPALRVPEHRADGFLLLVKKAHLAPQLAVVALGRLLQHGEIGFEALFILPAGAVDPLKLLVVGVAAPVGAGDALQLEGVTQLAGGRQMRPPAKVEPVALAVDRDDLLTRQRGDVLGLVGLADRLEVLDRLLTVPDLTLDGLVALDDLMHALFDLLQVFRREGLAAREVIVETVLGRRAEGDLRARV